MDNMRDWMGPEHFPPCPCFQMDESISNEMYTMAQEHANSLVAEMVMAGYCEMAMPYAIALFTNMCVSMIASKITSQEHPSANPEGLTAFSERQHKLLKCVTERQDALMRRADRVTFGHQGASDSVQ